MLSTFNIVMIVIIILQLSIIGYMMLNKKTNNKNLLDNVTKFFGIKIVGKTSENFDSNFELTYDSIPKNIMLCLNYLCSAMDINEINKLLKENGLDKTAEQIFKEHENMDAIKYLKIFNIDHLSNINAYNVFNNTDDNKIKDQIRLFLISQYAYANLSINKALKTDPSAIEYARQFNIDYIKLEIDSSYKTNDNFILYYRTNINKDIPIEQATESRDDTCITTTKLCKRTVNIAESINILKENAIENIKDINRLFNLMFVKYLFDLNNVNNDGNSKTTPKLLPPNTVDEITNITNTLLNKPKRIQFRTKIEVG